jgi:hypothetical protein
MQPYPRDSYPHLETAIGIDETLALSAASWGLGQIMGENHAKAGFFTPQAMVTAFCAGEDEQIDGMAAFIIHAGLGGDLKLRKWAAFARGYNGDSYAKNHYDTRLALAYHHAKAGVAS